jgi:hypothetical protein
MRLTELLMGARIAQALHLVVQKGIADILGDDRKLPDELAATLDIPSQAMRRLLRALTDVGVFQEDRDGRFANNEISAISVGVASRRFAI